MAKYRKKPVEVEAFQFTQERHGSNAEWPEWLLMAWNNEPPKVGALFRKSGDGPVSYLISTLEGALHISVDDWLIQGIQGELYPCKPDIFEATYELVKEESNV